MIIEQTIFSMKTISNTEEPFHHLLCLLNNIENQPSQLLYSYQTFFNSFLQNTSTFSTHINEPFQMRDNHNNITKTNAFNLIYTLGNYIPIDLFKQLFEKGIIISGFEEFTDSTQEEKHITHNILFKNFLQSSEKQIYLWEKFLHQYGQNTFEECLRENHTLFLAVHGSHFSLLDFLFQKISINFLNNNLESPIFFANKLSTLDYLSKFQPYWHQKNIYQEDCLSKFQKSSLPEKNFMKDYVLEKMKQQPVQETNHEQSYIQKRIIQNLIEMIQSKSTKKELQQFIKNNHIQNLSSIQDSRHTYLGHLLLEKEEVAKIELFSPFDLYHINDRKENVFMSLYFKNYVFTSTKIQAFSNIMQNCLKNPNKNMNQDVCNRFLDKGFDMQEKSFIPTWLFRKFQTNPDLEKKFLQVFDLNEKFDLQPYIKYSLTSFDANKEERISMKLFLLLFQNLIQKYPIDMIENPQKIQSYILSDIETTYPYFPESTFLYLFEIKQLFQTNLPHFQSKEWLHSVFQNYPDYLNKLSTLQKTQLVENTDFYQNHFEIFYLKPLFQLIQKTQFLELYEFIPVTILEDFFKNEKNKNEFSELFIYHQKKLLDEQLISHGTHKPHKI